MKTPNNNNAVRACAFVCKEWNRLNETHGKIILFDVNKNYISYARLLSSSLLLLYATEMVRSSHCS